jgi:hypothetical protein
MEMPEELDESEYYEENFLNSMADAHRGIFDSEYFCKNYKKEISITEGSRFIFEYFIFNSLYSVDWKEPFEGGVIKKHELGKSELAMQRKFIKYLRPRTEVTKIHQVIQNYILPFKKHEVFDNVPSLRISGEEERDGKDFCSYVINIQKLINKNEIKNKFYENLQRCLRFIYAVRNNIFHGTKIPGDYWDEDQRLRVDLYSKIIGATNELFFAIKIRDGRF